jgi:hypothetical protein
MPTEMHDYNGDIFEVGFDQLLYPRDAAAALCISVPTLALWAKQGKIACTWSAGNKRRYFAESVRCAQLGMWEEAALSPDELVALRRRKKAEARGASVGA